MAETREINPLMKQVLELGPVNESIHKVNEHIAVDDIPKLTKIYQRMLELLLLPA